MADKYKIQQDINLIDAKVADLKSSSGVAVSDAIGNLLMAKAQLVAVAVASDQMDQYEEAMKDMDP